MKQPKSDTAPARETPPAIEWLVMFAILLATWIAYIPCITGGFLWDDPEYIRDNILLRDSTGLVKIWTSPTSVQQWYPVTFTSFWIDYQLWGLETGGYHLVNLLLHCGSAILTWRLLRKLGLPGALLAAGIFALHPVMSESVAWMTERKNTLSLFLALWALWFRVKSPDRFEWRSFVLFLLALLSKSVVATLPAVFLVVVWWKEGRIPRAAWLRTIPFFAAGIAMASVTAFLESHHVGASAALTPELNLTFLQRLVIAGRVIGFYAFKLAWPVNQSFIYPRWEIPTGVSMQLLFPAAVVAVLIVLFLLNRRIGRGPLAATAIFCGVLLPVLGFFNVYPMRFSFVADHFVYHASIAFFALIAAGLTRVHRHLAFAALVPLVVLTFHRANVYSDLRTLWEDTHTRNPSWMVKMNFGNAIRFGAATSPPQLQRADQLYREARDLNPDNAETHLLVGISAGARGDFSEAESCFREAVRRNSNHAESWYYLGESLRFQKRWGEAIEAYDRAIAVDPQFEKARTAREGAAKMLHSQP